MESSVVCVHCNAKLRLPATLTAGKRVKCPKCGELMAIPAPEEEAYAVEVVEAEEPVQTLTAARKRCPFCGEHVLADAVKCRHCGEFFESAGQPSKKRPGTTEELTPAEYIVATIFCPIGLVIGIVWAAQKSSKAKQMVQASALSSVIALTAGLLAWHYYFRPTDTGLRSPDGWVGGVPPGYTYAPGDDELRQLQPSARSDMPPDMSELDRQPVEIQRAMRANVRIQTSDRGGTGSGVIVQKQGETALIITNRHVVDTIFAASHGAAQTALSRLPSPTITFVTGEQTEGKVVWLANDEIDLALVQAPCPEGVEPASWESSADVQIGDAVFAVGNPAGLGWTLTRGAVSALRYHEYGSRKVAVVQTDTRIGPGNSGGGLYNQKGELIGINTFVMSSSLSDAGETGLGFAIRKNVLLELKPEVLRLSGPSSSP